MCLAGLCVVLAGAWGTVVAQSRAAQVMVVTGSVIAIDTQGQRRQLVKGSDVRPGDSIVTGEGALAQIRMADGGFISIRSATEMAIDRFVFDEKESSKSNFLVSLVKGGFRSITGLIGKTNPNAYQIRSATATIGIRGTDHEPMVILPGNPSLGAPGLYDKVNEGETFIRSERGLLALRRGQIGFAPMVPTQAPQALQRVPDFYKVDIKTDARDPKDAVTTSKAPEPDKPAADTAVLLRPSTAARRDALKDPDALLVAPGISTSITTLAAPAAGNVLTAATGVAVTPGSVLSTTTTLIGPASASVSNAAVLMSPATQLVSPAAALVLAPNLNLVSPSVTLAAPAVNLVSPISTLAVPAVNLVPSAATMVTPITMVAPVTAVAAPASILVAPVTTVVAPVIAAPALVVAPPVLVAPITTIKSIVVK